MSQYSANGRRVALFTPEELAELKRIDEEIDNDDGLTMEEYRESRERDRSARLDKKIAAAERSLAYYYAHREECRARQRAYRAAHREELLAKQRKRLAENKDAVNAYRRGWYKAYYAANPDKHEARKAYMREYRLKRATQEGKTV